jgi:hypothetical protein
LQQGSQAARPANTLYIEPGSPWENGYFESFNSKLRDESLSGEISYSMNELRVLARTHQHRQTTLAAEYRPPVPAAWPLYCVEHGDGWFDLVGRLFERLYPVAADRRWGWGQSTPFVLLHSIGTPTKVVTQRLMSFKDKCVDIKAILAEPEQPRKLGVHTIIAMQADQGITITRKQTEAAYLKVLKEKGKRKCP